MGTPFSYDIGAGALSARAIAAPPSFDGARAVMLYDDVARRLVQGLKFSDRTDLAPWMAQWMVQVAQEQLGPDSIVVPVPLHRTRMFTRKFNQSAELGRTIAAQSGATFVGHALQRVKATPQQVGLGRKERAANVRGAFRVATEHKILITGRKVILVDDVFTTGATLDACSRALRRAGAEHVFCLTFARVAEGVAVNEL